MIIVSDTGAVMIKKLAKWVFTVQEHGDPELTAFRLGKCEACPHFVKPTRRCGLCGCFMDIKATLATNKSMNGVQITHCPDGRWDDKHLSYRYAETGGLSSS